MSRTHGIFEGAVAGSAVVLVLGTAWAAPRGAEPFTLPWYTIDGGGAMYLTGGGFTLGSSIGQADAGPVMTGGEFQLVGGFWAATASRSAPSCPADLDGNGIVDGSDLGELLGNWGGSGVGDLTGDGVVDGADLGELLGSWGNCPG